MTTPFPDYFLPAGERAAAPERAGVSPSGAGSAASRVVVIACALAMTGVAPWAAAQDAAPSAADAERAGLQQLRDTTLALIDALVEQGLLSRAKADELLRKAQRPAAAVAAAPPPAAAEWGARAPSVVRVPYLPESVRAQMKAELKNDILATARDENWIDARQMPDWLKGVKLEGDVRVRAEADLFANDNTARELYQLQNVIGASPAWSPDLVETQRDRQRLTLRARLGVTVKAGEDVSAGVRLASGATTGPTSESVTMGNDFNRSAVTLDRAWVRWEPRQGLRLDAGRMAVPFDGTDLLWPDDLAVEGVSAHGELDLARGVYAFSTIGAFPLQEFAISGQDKWLYGGQVGVDWALGSAWQLRGAVGLYEFRNIEGRRETALAPTGPFAGTTPYQLSQYPAGVRQKGNTLIDLNAPTSTATSAVWGLASRFKPFDVTLGLVDRQFEPFQVGASIDYVRNTGFDSADIVRRFGDEAPPELQSLAAMTTGWQARLNFGKARMQERGDWTGFVAWRRFERDAWPDAFTDTTWNLGGTNYKGYSIGASYLFDRHATVGARWTSTRNLDDGSNGNDLSAARLKIDVLQVETNVKF